MRIDLHTHSRASDGTESAPQVMQAAADAGLDVVALTDHDTIAGWAAAAAAVPAGLTLVRGAEISCRVKDVALHLLAYLFDPEDAGLATALAQVRSSRVPRAREMVERMRASGLPVSWQQVSDEVEPGATVGRPHIADALVRAGVVADRDEAFRGPLSSRSPHYVRHVSLDPVVAVRAVRRAGGVPVLAHPYAHHRGQAVDDATVEAMTEAGLGGLEVHHRDHAPEDVVRLQRLARGLGLLQTGSSDYHGSGKLNRIGENTTAPEVYEALVGQATLPVVRG